MWSAKVGRFPADRRRRLTSTQPSHSSRPGSPLSRLSFPDVDVEVFRLCWLFSVRVNLAVLRRCGESQVSGSSRQDLPAVSCLIGTPPVLFFFSAVLLISRSPVVCHMAEFKPLFFLSSSSLFPRSVSVTTSCLKCGRVKRVSAAH